jgi:predicted dehydrogenase
MDLVGVGVVGYGYWGPNLVRNFANSEASRVLSVSDLDQAKLAASKRLHSDIVTTSDFRDLLRDSRIDAVAIATPVHTHYDLALSALTAGKHVFVEKPLAPTSDQVRRLIDEADRRSLTLMVTTRSCIRQLCKKYANSCWRKRSERFIITTVFVRAWVFFNVT